MSWLDILLVSLAVVSAGGYLAFVIWRACARRGKAEANFGCACHTCHIPENVSNPSNASVQVKKSR